MTDYTVENLVQMSDGDFHKAVMDDLKDTSRHQGPFQDAAVIERTMTALVEWLWITNAKLDDRAEDPNCQPELYAKTERFRSHLLSVIENTDRRIAWRMGSKEREVRKWKQVLFEVVDAIQQGWDDDDILQIKIPSHGNAEETYDVETWWEIRLEKEPNRKRAMKGAA